MPTLQEALELCRQQLLKLVAANCGIALRAVGIRMYEKSVLNWQEYPVVLRYVQVHADCGCVRFAVEILEVQARLDDATFLVGIAFLPGKIPVLFKNPARLFLNKIADLI